MAKKLKGSITTPIQVPSLANNIRQDMEKKMRARLGLAKDQPLPSDISELIKGTSESAATAAINLAVSRDAEAGTRDATRGATFQSFTDKVVAARQGIEFIAASQDVSDILKRRSDLLWAKRKALETAGFSKEEAMQILLTDIAAHQK